MIGLEGRDESERQRTESQWIMAASTLCHLQFVIEYLSCLQRILPTARLKLYFKVAIVTVSMRCLSQQHVPPGPRPLLRVGKQTASGYVTSNPDSDLEVFSNNPAYGSFAPLAFQPSPMTNYVAPHPNYVPDNVFLPDRPAERALVPKRGAVPRLRFTK
ncbi:hypothetical protein CQW23_03286 [Capsicum baccatum]|uniref:Uncharacterized protein n=1 Tax=Capsicum baccatum TaxID=33114 RepID=A0A2G2XBE7_CAPBA|nr:hypothetical protein CQW23_03286 [Capsicum baccatum]